MKYLDFKVKTSLKHKVKIKTIKSAGFIKIDTVYTEMKIKEIQETKEKQRTSQTILQFSVPLIFT